MNNMSLMIIKKMIMIEMNDRIIIDISMNRIIDSYRIHIITGSFPIMTIIGYGIDMMCFNLLSAGICGGLSTWINTRFA
jgi:hypothetical protein